MQSKAKVTQLRTALQTREEIKAALDGDPQYQALRLRGLAGLIRASEDGLAEITNTHEVAFFLASVVDEIAEALAPEPWSRRRK